ncbi:MAG TPA: hypothetical protein VFX03_00010, partial [Thermomicrobiales bacterium]|nr:hypothetical protein [Thermomicrobiales bacterium]
AFAPNVKLSGARIPDTSQETIPSSSPRLAPGLRRLALQFDESGRRIAAGGALRWLAARQLVGLAPGRIYSRIRLEVLHHE